MIHYHTQPLKQTSQHVTIIWKLAVLSSLIVIQIAPTATAQLDTRWQIGGSWLTNRSPYQPDHKQSLPIKWSDTDNVAWSIDLPGIGSSTPIIVNDKIVLTYCSVTEGNEKNFVACYDSSGQQVWAKESGAAASGKHKNATGANSTPVSDGATIVAYFKSGDLSAFTTDGDLIWSKNIQNEYEEDTLWWDLATSPVIYDGKVLLAVMQTGPSFLITFDLKTGDEIWKTDRILDADGESNQSYTTPAIGEENGQRKIVTFGADYLTIHDGETGQQLLKQGGFNPRGQSNNRSIASPMVYRTSAYASFDRGQSIRETPWQDQHRDLKRLGTTVHNVGNDVPTPVKVRNRIFLVGNNGTVTCMQAKPFRLLWQERLPKSRFKFYSSPLLTEEHVYFTREDGATFVLANSLKYEFVGANTIKQDTVATPIAYEGSIIIRSRNKLMLIGEQP